MFQNTVYPNIFKTTILALVVCFSAQSTFAQNSWINPAGGMYNEAANWSDGVPPAVDDDAEFAIDGSYQVSWDSTVGNTINNDFDIDNGDISFQSIGGTFTHTVDQNFRIGSASVTLGREGGNPFRLQLGTSDSGTASLTMGGFLGGSSMNVTHGSSVRASRSIFIAGGQLGTADSDTTLRLEQGGVLETLEQISVRGADTAARIQISGAGSKLSGDFMQVTSRRGESHIVVENKGLLETNNRFVFGPSGGPEIPEPTSLTVTGDGSRFHVIAPGGSSRDGDAEFFSGTVRIDAGAKMTADGLTFIAIGADRTATATIAGPGSELNTDSVYVGDSGGNGTLHVLDGAMINSTAGRISTQSYSHPETRGSSTGTAVVDGSGSRWNNTFGMFVGSADGTGRLTISNGAVVTAPKSFIGGSSDSDGTIVVNGTESLFDVANELRVGANGNGNLTIENGGRVNGGTMTNIRPRGTVDLAGGTLDVSGSIDNQGQIRSKGESSIAGQLTMNGSESGLHVLSGQTDLIGDLSYNEGEIRIDDGSVLLIAGEAIGVGSYLGEGTVVFAQTLSPGNSAAAIGFEGDVVIAEATKTVIELGGTDSGEFDQLLIDGELTIEQGGLIVDLIDDFELELGDRFLIASVGGGLEGQFFGLGEGDLVDTFDGTDLFITYRGFGGNRGVGLFTVAIPEPTSGILLAAIFIRFQLRRRRRGESGRRSNSL